MYNLGITFSQESKKEDAFSWNKKAAEKKHPNAAYFVALKYHADKNTEKALSWAEKSFEYGVIGGMGLAGSIHQGSGDHEKAISCFKKLLSKDEANHEVMTSMGFSYLALHKTDEALQSFNKAVSLGNMKALAVLMELQSIE